MNSQLLVNPGKLSVVELTRGTCRVRLALWLADEFTGDELVKFSRDASVSVEGADALAASYKRANWLSGVTSGALYAFRTLRLPRQRVVLTEFSVRLPASDMEAVANAVVIAIAKLADKEAPALEIEGWTIQGQLAEWSPTIPSPHTNQEERVFSSPAESVRKE